MKEFTLKHFMMLYVFDKNRVFSQCGQVSFGGSCRDWYIQNVPRKRQEMKVN